MIRLVNTLLKTAHAACDLGDHEVARAILGVVEQMLGKFPDAPRRRIAMAVVTAFERLWELRHPEVEA